MSGWQARAPATGRGCSCSGQSASICSTFQHLPFPCGRLRPRPMSRTTGCEPTWHTGSFTKRAFPRTFASPAFSSSSTGSTCPGSSASNERAWTRSPCLHGSSWAGTGWSFLTQWGGTSPSCSRRLHAGARHSPRTPDGFSPGTEPEPTCHRTGSEFGWPSTASTPARCATPCYSTGRDRPAENFGQAP